MKLNIELKNLRKGFLLNKENLIIIRRNLYKALIIILLIMIIVLISKNYLIMLFIIYPLYQILKYFLFLKDYKIKNKVISCKENNILFLKEYIKKLEIRDKKKLTIILDNKQINELTSYFNSSLMDEEIIEKIINNKN
ncbi:MAG: hypothetical protein RRY16_02240 [Bacilli bacterium]